VENEEDQEDVTATIRWMEELAGTGEQRPPVAP